MRKAKAIELLGGSVGSAARAVGVSYQAVDKWPDDLPPRISDRVLAAVARKHLPADLIGEEAVKGGDVVPVAVDTGERRRSTDNVGRAAAGGGL